jgi:hypothetical protein
VPLKTLRDHFIHGLFLLERKSKVLQHCYLHRPSGDDFWELARELLPIAIMDVELCEGKIINLNFHTLVMKTSWGMESSRGILDVGGTAARARCSTMYRSMFTSTMLSRGRIRMNSAGSSDR